MDLVFPFGGTHSPHSISHTCSHTSHSYCDEVTRPAFCLPADLFSIYLKTTRLEDQDPKARLCAAGARSVSDEVIPEDSSVADV